MNREKKTPPAPRYFRVLPTAITLDGLIAQYCRWAPRLHRRPADFAQLNREFTVAVRFLGDHSPLARERDEAAILLGQLRREPITGPDTVPLLARRARDCGYAPSAGEVLRRLRAVHPDPDNENR